MVHTKSLNNWSCGSQLEEEELKFKKFKYCFTMIVMFLRWVPCPCQLGSVHFPMMESWPSLAVCWLGFLWTFALESCWFWDTFLDYWRSALLLVSIFIISYMWTTRGREKKNVSEAQKTKQRIKKIKKKAVAMCKFYQRSFRCIVYLFLFFVFIFYIC